jgi:diphthamide synthase (EF-2-diphthine--ammonia ligase)
VHHDCYYNRGSDVGARSLALSLARPLARQALAFGDIHLRTVRDWREASLSATYTLLFPLWNREASWLLERLDEACEAFQVDVCIAAIDGDDKAARPLAEGDPYDDAARDAISAAGWDLFGENGEFHTRIVLRT